jgi:hypothetical protein
MIAENFLDAALGNSLGCWDQKQLATIAGKVVPDLILARNSALLRSDAHQQWARWFVESFVDPRSYRADQIEYTQVFRDVWNSVNSQLSHISHSERRQIASKVAKTVHEIAIRISNINNRSTTSKKTKRLLLELAGSPPRCFHCGVIFTEEAIDNYLGNERAEIKLPLLIDILRPRGINKRDLQIEIDHIIPFSKGGGDDENLKLACGWCNRHKSNFLSIYDISGIPISSGPNSIGLKSIPHPFWSLRLLSIRGICEHHGGCSKNLKNDHLMIAPICETGAFNPTNLQVTCSEHDPFIKKRFHPISVVKNVWRYNDRNNF